MRHLLALARVRALTAGLVLLLLLAPARGAPPGCCPDFLAAERALGTHLEYQRRFHQILRVARPMHLGMPGLLVGVEKADRCRIDAPPGKELLKELNDEAPQFRCYREWLCDRVDESRPTFVSHIARYDAGRCDTQFVYNTYARGRNAGRGAFRAGWNALCDVRHTLTEMLATYRPTHLVVAAVGWRTSQYDGIRTWRRLLTTMQRLARHDGAAPFRPLTIVVTWPSNWPAGIFGEIASYFAKAHDADEVGLLWCNVLLHDVVAPAVQQTGTPVVVAGHSFGIRMLSRAMVSRPLIRRGERCQRTTPVDLVLGLQGAFDLERLIRNDGAEGAPYALLPYVGKAQWVLTSSRGDLANVSARFVTGSLHVGGRLAWDRARRYPYLFQQARVRCDGTWCARPGPRGRCHDKRVLYLDASRIISEHVDVENARVARMMLHAVRTFAR